MGKFTDKSFESLCKDYSIREIDEPWYLVLEKQDALT